MGIKMKPTKPMAVFGAFVGLAMLVLALTSFSRVTPFLVVWLVVVVGIVAINLWAAFSKDGALYSFHSSDHERPSRIPR